MGKGLDSDNLDKNWKGNFSVKKNNLFSSFMLILIGKVGL